MAFDENAIHGPQDQATLTQGIGLRSQLNGHFQTATANPNVPVSQMGPAMQADLSPVMQPAGQQISLDGQKPDFWAGLKSERNPVMDGVENASASLKSQQGVGYAMDTIGAQGAELAKGIFDLINPAANGPDMEPEPLQQQMAMQNQMRFGMM